MATQWISPTWRMPEESNQDKVDNYSLEFSGSLEYISTSDIVVDYTTGWSISFWFNANTIGQDSLMGRWDSNWRGAYLSNSGTELRWYDGSNKTFTIPTVSTSEWHNAVFINDNGTLKCYLDGTESSTGSLTSNFNLTINRMGGGTSGWGGIADFDGKMAQCCVFETALTPTQITALYNSGTPVNPLALTPLPIAYYPLGGSSTGSASTLTIPNESVPDATVFEFNVPSGGIDRITLDQAITLTGNKTFSAWINLTMAQDAGGFIFFAEATTNYYLYIQGDYMYIRDASGVSSAQYTPGFSLNTWYHICISGDGTNLIPYVNGEPISGTYIDREMQSENTIGSYSNSTFPYRGEMSNVQIWDTNLSGPEVTTLYNNGVPLFSGTQPQAANLKVWYPMNVDNANWLGSDWQIADANSAYPQSFDFEAQDYIGLTKNFNLTGALTISAWINTTDTSVYGFIVSEDTTSGANRDWIFMRDYSKLSFYFWDASGTLNTCSSSNLSIWDGKWHNVIVVWDGTTNADSMKLFVDKELVKVFTPTISSIRTTTATRNISFNHTTYDFVGKLSNIQMWDTPLTYGSASTSGDIATGQVAELYNNGSPITTAIESSNLQAWYKLDNSATFSTNWTIPDASGNGNTGTSSGMTEQNLVNNNVSVLNGESSGMTTANLVNSDLTRSIPYSSYSMFFEGIDDVVQITRSADLEPANITVSCWVNVSLTGSHTNGYFVNKMHTSGSIVSYGIYKPATPTFLINVGGVIKYSPVYGTDIRGQGWHHLVGTYDGAHIRLYVNGVEVGSGTAETGSIDYTTEDAYIGSFEPSLLEIDGNISNVSIFNTALTEDQILTIYNGGVPKDISSLSPVSWWSLAGDSYFDGTNWICPDLGSGSNNGTSANMAGSELVGDGPGSSANGTATNMDIPVNLKGDAPNSSNNAFSVNMDSQDRVASVPS